MCCKPVIHGKTCRRSLLRQRYDVLATSTRLASRRRVGAITFGDASTIARTRPDRLGAGKSRWRQRFQPPGGQETGPNPTDRGKLGSKRHIAVDARGIPLAVTVTGANRHDSMAFEPTLNAIPAVPGLSGQPRKRPGKLHADKGYDFTRCRRYLKQRGIKARIARRGVESSERLGRHRWVVESTHAWIAGFGKLRIRFERRLDIHVALLALAAAVICSRFVDDLC
nr:IS5 family transposase [Burkholderia lata]